jgi:phosphoglucosamine mutase
VPRRYFGTDGVRGVVGEDLTLDLVERFGRAIATWEGPALVGRDTRASGLELELALVRGMSDVGEVPALVGVLPTPAVALEALEVGVVITASHNPPQYNGLKLFDRNGGKLLDAAEEEIEALLDTPPEGQSLAFYHRQGVLSAYEKHIVEHFGTDLSGLRIAVDCANGSFSYIAPGALLDFGADVEAVASWPDGSNINVGCGATDLSLLQSTVRGGRFDLGVAFDGDGDRMLAVDADGNAVDGDQILAVVALHLEVDLVVVTSMTNLGFHELMKAHGIRVVTTDVGDRYVLEALRREGGILGGEQSGHLICLDGHVTGDGLAAALLLCRALEGRPLAEAAAEMPRYPQVKENIPTARTEVSEEVLSEVERVNAELGDSGRVVVRPSGTQPVVRVLVEARDRVRAERLCARIAALVRRELG